MLLSKYLRTVSIIFALNHGSGIAATITDISTSGDLLNFGTYQSLEEHPGVFTTWIEVRELAKRINVRGSYSFEQFARLSTRVAHDLSANRAWDSAYSGCKISTYLYAFSYELEPASEDQKIRDDLHLQPSTKVPAGAAIVASRFALYSALAKAGAVLPEKAPDPKVAASAAKRILVAWAEHGFRGAGGRFLSSPSQFCLDDGRVNAFSETQVGLQVSRGVVYSVYAQDLLMHLDVLDADEIIDLNTFHSAMYELVRNAHNFDFTERTAWHKDCERYSNQIGSQLTALLAIARLLDNRPRFDAALFGNESAIPIVLPWLAYFGKVIYGNKQKPNSCYSNTGASGLVSRPSFQTDTVAPGEIDDRNRNGNPLQGIGYPMGTLQWLYDSAEILRGAGFNPYNYRGPNGQSIEIATRYYACYAAGAGFEKIVTAENSGNCPDVTQYIGKVVNGVERNIVIGAYRFPDDPIITKLEKTAKLAAESGPFSLDPIYFGRWRD